jgi:hypothetical protein
MAHRRVHPLEVSVEELSRLVILAVRQVPVPVEHYLAARLAAIE